MRCKSSGEEKEGNRVAKVFSFEKMSQGHVIEYGVHWICFSTFTMLLDCSYLIPGEYWVALVEDDEYNKEKVWL